MSDTRLHIGDCREILPALPEKSVQMCVTSPPYWGLRDYGTARWEGGDSECDHAQSRQPQSLAKLADKMAPRKNPRNPTRQDDEQINTRLYRGACGKCGARRIDTQLGLESTPEEFVATMVEVFREVRRVLRDDGVLWLNLGDSYASKPSTSNGYNDGRANRNERMSGGVPYGMKPKNLIGIPWRVAFALQSDGWYLRQDIIWHKPNPMPESVTDRCTKAHEYMFLLSKSPRYYFDAEAIKEPVSGTANARGSGVNPKALGGDHPRNVDSRYQAPGMPEHTGLRKPGIRAKQNASFSAAVKGLVDNRNKRSVWTVQSHAYSEAHFATFPPALIEPCILAGSRPGDVVLDPFFGSGTTGEVCERLGRKWLGIELNSEYGEMSNRRTAQQGLGI